MALITADRVKETSTTTGTGTLTLAGAVNGFKSFADIGNGNQCYYAIVGVAVPSEWEVGIGTYTASGTTLSRDTVLRSSTGSKVSFSAGTKEVFVTYPADHSLSQADTGTAPNQVPLNQYLGSMAYEDNDNVNITGGVATLSTATITNIQNNTDISNVEPSLLLDFAKAKTLDPRITFTRASAATYYDGKTVSKAEENLLLYSQEFDNAYWTKSNATVTANAATAPDGTSTAESMLEAANTAFHGIIRSVPTVSGVAHTASVYVKANGRNYFLIYTNAGSLGKYFDITAGGGGSVLGNYGAGPTSAAISYIGNDWYRCSITFNTLATATFIEFYASDTGSNASYAGDITKGVYIWGAQLEQRSAASAYTPTTTQPITNYIPTLLSAPANVARFDHDPITAESKGLLIEESRANIALRSEEFDNASWTKTRSSIVANTIVAPDGTLTGDKLIEDTTASNTHQVQSTVTSIASSVHTGSVYVKAAERTWMLMQIGSSSAGTAYFNLANGTIGTVTAGYTATISPVSNGWYRCTLSGTIATSASSPLRFYLASDGATFQYTGDGYSGIYIWGAQLEAGAFPTSYIKTEGSQVTRSADAASMTGTNFSSWYNASEGTLYADASGIYGVSGTNYFVACVDDNTINNEFVIRRAETQLQVVSNTNTVTYAALTSSFSASNLSVFKIAGTYKVDSFAASFNGASASEDTSGIVVSGANTFRIGYPASTSGGRRGMTGYIRKLAYYPKRLANAELVEMTA